MATGNIKLTSIQKDYRELCSRRDTIVEAALARLNQLDKDINSLDNEKIKLEDMLEDIRTSNLYKSPDALDS